MTVKQAKHAYPNPAWLPAHECVRLRICWYCGAPCKVERLPVGHVTVPNCGKCGRKMPCDDREADC